MGTKRWSRSCKSSKLVSFWSICSASMVWSWYVCVLRIPSGPLKFYTVYVNFSAFISAQKRLSPFEISAEYDMAWMRNASNHLDAIFSSLFDFSGKKDSLQRIDFDTSFRFTVMMIERKTESFESPNALHIATDDLTPLCNSTITNPNIFSSEYCKSWI